MPASKNYCRRLAYGPTGFRRNDEGNKSRLPVESGVEPRAFDNPFASLLTAIGPPNAGGLDAICSVNVLCVEQMIDLGPLGKGILGGRRWCGIVSRSMQGLH